MQNQPTLTFHRGRSGRDRTMLACGIAAVCLVVTLILRGDEPRQPSESGPSIEPNAGSWRTWVISSGKDFRVPPPPGKRETRAELETLKNLISHNDAQTQQQIEFWDAGAPA